MYIYVWTMMEREASMMFSRMIKKRCIIQDTAEAAMQSESLLIFTAVNSVHFGVADGVESSPLLIRKEWKKSLQPFFRHLSAFSLRIATTKTKRVFAAVSIGEKKLSPNDTRFCVSYLPHIEIRHKSEFSPLLIFTFDSWLGRVICCTRF